MAGRGTARPPACVDRLSRSATVRTADASGSGRRSRAETSQYVAVPPGVGKTHLAIALGVKAVEAGHLVLFLTLESLMGRLVRGRHENRLERTLQQLAYPRVLILDLW